MKVELKIDPSCKEISVVVTAARMSEDVDLLLKKLDAGKQQEVLLGFSNGNAEIMHPDEIIRIYASVQKVFIVTQSGEYVSRLRLYELEEKMDDSSFVRISNSEIINLKKVKGFDLRLSGTICVKFLNGTTSYVSRRYVSKIKQILGM